MSEENQSSLLRSAETMEKKPTQRQKLRVSEVSPRIDRQTGSRKAEEEPSLKEGNCRIQESTAQR